MRGHISKKRRKLVLPLVAVPYKRQLDGIGVHQDKVDRYCRVFFLNIVLYLGVPGNVCVERGDRRIMLLVTLDERVLINLPDFLLEDENLE